MNIVLLGKPGAGKGYVSEILKNEYGFNHISTGNLCRENIKNNTKLGVLASTYVQKGDLVPLDIILDMLKQALNNSSDNYIFDGFPRTLIQAQQLNKITPVDYVILVDVPNDIILQRVAKRRICPNCSKLFSTDEVQDEICIVCNTKLTIRADDNLEVAKKRLQLYETETKPLVDFYKDKLLILDNSKDLENTKQQIKEITERIYAKFKENV
ncbi:MAG: nucleoside monophosphate kinase [Clostridiales bacterium]|nr:nucleoside monophosphate kinase [Clostridiales bacterium]